MEKKYIKKYDYRLFDGLSNLCPLISQYKINKIDNLNLSIIEIEDYIWDIKNKIMKKENAVSIFSLYILFDLRIGRKPFVNYEGKYKARLKMIFCLIIDTIVNTKAENPQPMCLPSNSCFL